MNGFNHTSAWFCSTFTQTSHSKHEVVLPLWQYKGWFYHDGSKMCHISSYPSLSHPNALLIWLQISVACMRKWLCIRQHWYSAMKMKFQEIMFEFLQYLGFYSKLLTKIMFFIKSLGDFKLFSNQKVHFFVSTNSGKSCV